MESRAGVPSLRPRQSDQRAHRVDWWSARAIVVLCVCVVVRTPTSSLMKGGGAPPNRALKRRYEVKGRNK